MTQGARRRELNRTAFSVLLAVVWVYAFWQWAVAGISYGREGQWSFWPFAFAMVLTILIWAVAQADEQKDN